MTSCTTFILRIFHTLKICYSHSLCIIPIAIPIMSHMATPILMGFPFPWDIPLPCTPLILMYPFLYYLNRAKISWVIWGHGPRPSKYANAIICLSVRLWACLVCGHSYRPSRNFIRF